MRYELQKKLYYEAKAMLTVIVFVPLALLFGLTLALLIQRLEDGL
jgi:ABC-type sulfate transport system permease subunit